MRKYVHICIAAVLAALLGGCTSQVKLTTVRPAEISELRVERLADGAIAALPRSAAEADLKDLLIFQLEEPYDKTGACAETDGHKYRASLYILDKLDTEVLLNEDGSVCRGGSRYVPSAAADAPVSLADWDACFAAAP